MSEPISVTDQEKRILAEQDAIRLAVGDLSLAWATVENCMTMLLQEIIRDHMNGFLASAIYFSPSSIETRTRIVDDALKMYSLNLVFKERFLARWHSIMNTLDRLRKARNKVSHGQIKIFHFGDRPSFARLTSPALQFNEEENASVRKGQKPGMGSNEINNSVKAVWSVSGRITRFKEYVQMINRGEISTFLQKFDEEEAKHGVADSR